LCRILVCLVVFVMRMKVFVLFSLLVACWAASIDDCQQCDRSQCEELVTEDCVAGIVLDRCGCCQTCAKSEYELCDHPQIAGTDHGSCGDNLECVVRSDLGEEDGPEAICRCIYQESLCGSDGVSYVNLCAVAAASIRTQSKIKVESKGMCKQAPVIVSKPDSLKERRGESAALVCEATGYPIPTVEWVWTRSDGKTVLLPNDDLHLAVNMRGGPEQYQVTGWLQIMQIEERHEGDYTCIAQNELGVEQATGRVKVINEM